ncbi:MAG: nitroreductase family protein [Calditrichaceae bacterium]
MKQPRLIPLKSFHEYTESEMLDRARRFYTDISSRRSIRNFSDKEVPKNIIEYCIRSACTAPSGANKQPWYFAAVSDPAVKREIRIAAENEERAFYHSRATKEWLDDLAPIGTDEHKPFLETAPWLIAIFDQRYGINSDGKKEKHYYTAESVGIATGMLITALHLSGLATLTHTPSPMGFLNKILNRPENEKPFLLLVVGYPSKEAMVPEITKKAPGEIYSFI